MLFNLQSLQFKSIYRFANIPEDLVAVRDPDLTSIFRQTVQPVRVWLIRQHGGKTRIGLMCFVFPSTWIKSGKKSRPVRSPLDFSDIPTTQTHTREWWTMRDGEGTSWFRVRPGRRARKAMGTAGHRREDVRSSAEMWRAEGWNRSLNKPSRATGGGAAGPQGQSHQLHLGLWVLLDHCFFHGYQIRAFELMDYITGWCIVLEVQVSFDTVKGINWDFCSCTCCLNQTAVCGKDDWHRYRDPDVPVRDIYQEAVVLNAKLKTWHQTRHKHGKAAQKCSKWPHAKMG